MDIQLETPVYKIGEACALPLKKKPVADKAAVWKIGVDDEEEVDEDDLLDDDDLIKPAVASNYNLF